MPGIFLFKSSRKKQSRNVKRQGPSIRTCPKSLKAANAKFSDLSLPFVYIFQFIAIPKYQFEKNEILNFYSIVIKK